jgi:Uma2 family endonuclease
MSIETPAIQVHYPESDGKPMAETDLHRDWMVRIIDLLKTRYRGQQVYVSGDLILYYVEGDPRKSVVPDAFVVKNSDPGRRRVYKIWEEGRVPDVVFETTSDTTRFNDTTIKPPIYAELGIPEYFLYDPTADYLDPPLAGLRLVGGEYEPIEPDSQGRLLCRELSVTLFLEDDDLVMCDARTGRRLLTEAEAAHAEANAAKSRAKSARLKAKAEADNAQAAEQEVQRLRQKLREHGISD